MGGLTQKRGSAAAAGPAWLSRLVIAAIIVAACLPFLLVEVPPLVDVPGHIALAAIEQAEPQNTLARYYEWNWRFALNMGGELLMKALGTFMSPITAGWWVSVIATATLVGGALALARSLNRRGGHTVGWALIFAFGFPWLWGFVNFVLATGLSLVAAAAVIAQEDHPKRRAILLLVAQPAILVCHAVGGLLLPIIVASAAVGAELDSRLSRNPPSVKVAARTIIAKC